MTAEPGQPSDGSPDNVLELAATRERYERDGAMVVNMAEYRFELLGDPKDDLFTVALVHAPCFDSEAPNPSSVVHYVQDGDVMHALLHKINDHEKADHRPPRSDLEQALSPIPTEEPQ